MFVWVQVLRGLAASLVVLHHYLASQIERGAQVSHWLENLGASGVDIFFVISGFIMMITTSQMTRTPSAGDFLKRRLVRIAPLYWTLTAIAFAMVLAAGSAVNTVVSPQKFVASMLFLPYHDGAIDMGMLAHKAYVIPMAWTLTYEWYFYLVFALTLALGLRPAGRLMFMTTWFALTVGVGMLLQPTALIAQVVSQPMVFEFLLGCGIAMLYAKGWRIGGGAALLLALSGLFVLGQIFHHTAYDRTLYWGVAAFMLIAAATLYRGSQAETPFLRPFSWFGDISYSLYLSHFFTLALFVRLQRRFGALSDSFSPWTLIAFLLLVITVAAACYYGIEEPARKRFARRKRPLGAALNT
ncbi:MAG TPA: acyltransferase [Methylophilaceae bacterium]|nr:acyltransferase [Methylophilaceae bacterium]